MKLPNSRPVKFALAFVLIAGVADSATAEANARACRESVQAALHATSYETPWEKLTNLRRAAVTACSTFENDPEWSARALMLERWLPEYFLDYRAQLRLLDRAVDGLESTDLSRTEVMITVLDERAVTLRALGRDLDSLADIERANEIRLDLFGAGSAEWVQGQINLAFFEASQSESYALENGNEAAALRLRGALALSRNHPKTSPETEQRLLGLIAGLYREAGELGLAQEFQAQSDSVAGVDSDE